MRAATATLTGLLLATASAAAPPASKSVALGPTVMLRGGVAMPSIGTGSMGGCGPDSFGSPYPCAHIGHQLPTSALRVPNM